MCDSGRHSLLKTLGKFASTEARQTTACYFQPPVFDNCVAEEARISFFSFFFFSAKKKRENPGLDSFVIQDMHHDQHDCLKFGGAFGSTFLRFCHNAVFECRHAFKFVGRHDTLHHYHVSNKWQSNGLHLVLATARLCSSTVHFLQEVAFFRDRVLSLKQAEHAVCRVTDYQYLWMLISIANCHLICWIRQETHEFIWLFVDEIACRDWRPRQVAIPVRFISAKLEELEIWSSTKGSLRVSSISLLVGKLSSTSHLMMIIVLLMCCYR